MGAVDVVQQWALAAHLAAVDAEARRAVLDRGSVSADARRGPILSVMLAVSDVAAAADWYKRALGATELWRFGPVAGLEIAGAPFFLGQPARNGWQTPLEVGFATSRVEVFCDDPETFIRGALEAGASGSLATLEDHQRPWGVHRQGGFTDPFGHIWLVGDRTPLARWPKA